MTEELSNPRSTFYWGSVRTCRFGVLPVLQRRPLGVRTLTMDGRAGWCSFFFLSCLRPIFWAERDGAQGAKWEEGGFGLLGLGNSDGYPYYDLTMAIQWGVFSSFAFSLFCRPSIRKGHQSRWTCCCSFPVISVDMTKYWRLVVVLSTCCSFFLGLLYGRGRAAW